MEGEDDDVVMEGSELHRTLVSMGYTDFEFAPIKNNKSPPDVSVSRRNVRLAGIDNLFVSWARVAGFFRYALPASRVPATEQMQTILGAECLLDDHRALIGRLMENHSNHRDRCIFSINFIERSFFFISCATMIIGSATLAKNKIPGMFLAISVGAFGAYREYEYIRAVGSLKNLVNLQNELYRAYKRALGILRKLYRSNTDGDKGRSAFSALESDRLKFLQPLTENLSRSMENTCHAYQLAASLITPLLPENSLDGEASQSASNSNAFAIEGKITYDDLRRFYYVYILAQSDTLQLLAIGYNVDVQRADKGRASLTRISENLCGPLTRERNRLVPLLREYDHCKQRRTERKYRVGAASKWRDLYLNLDLLSRKLSTVYDEISSVLGEIEKRSQAETTGSGSSGGGVGLTARIHGIYSQIDESRNLAEFNELSMAILQRGCESAAGPIPEVDPYTTQIDQRIESDSEPQIIDEVFEEYSTNKGTKLLCEDREEEALSEVAKLDGLLAKNFMSELKDALVEKSKSMTEREARALLRKYPNECSNFEECNILQANPSKIDQSEKRVETKEESSRPTIPVRRRITGSRASVSLTRAPNAENVSWPPPPLPPPPPPPPPPFSEIETFKNKVFSLGLENLGTGKMPAFVTCEDEFVGSGDNSEEEQETSDFAS